MISLLSSHRSDALLVLDHRDMLRGLDDMAGVTGSLQFKPPRSGKDQTTETCDVCTSCCRRPYIILLQQFEPSGTDVQRAHVNKKSPFPQMWKKKGPNWD